MEKNSSKSMASQTAEALIDYITRKQMLPGDRMPTEVD